MALKQLEVLVTESLTGRADRVVQHLTELSRSQLRGLFDHQCVKINDQNCSDPGAVVALGDRVTVVFDPHTRYHQKKQQWSDRAFSLLYDDNDIIVVDKSSGVLTVPTDRGETNTLFDRVGVYLSRGRKKREPFVVHRLDRDVSGVLVMAKTELARSRLSDQFKDHIPERLYRAIVYGKVKAKEGTVRNLLATAKNLDRVVTQDENEGQLAITHYRVLQHLKDTTLIEVQLETGRRNQIRVHMAGLGHPLLGDERYGRHMRPHPKWQSKRIALHAAFLRFMHPKTGEMIQFESPLPPPLERFIRSQAVEESNGVS